MAVAGHCRAPTQGMEETRMEVWRDSGPTRKTTWEQRRGGEGWRLGLDFLANKMWVHLRRWRNGGQGPCSPPCCCCDLLIPHRQGLRSASHFVQTVFMGQHHQTSLCLDNTYKELSRPYFPVLQPSTLLGGPPRSAAQGARNTRCPTLTDSILNRDPWSRRVMLSAPPRDPQRPLHLCLVSSCKPF